MINVNDFNSSINKMIEESLKMDTVIVKQNDTVYKYVFEGGNERKNIRSISKVIVSMCTGIAISKGYFPDGVEELIFKYFSDRIITNVENIKYLECLKIKHLITLTMGHNERTMNSAQMASLQGKDLIDYILNFPICNEPGQSFLYTNPPAYLMSYIIQKVTGKKLLDFAKENIFNYLDISDITWKESEQGVNMGCTGIEINADDLLKIGELLLNDGKFNGTQVVPSEWIKFMKTLKVKTPMMFDEKRVLPKFGYGYNLWICENGTFYCDGTDGQYLIVVPDKKMVIVTMGYQSNMKPITECLRNIIL